MNCHIQIFLDGHWQTAAVFAPDEQTLDRGVAGGCLLQYDIDYAVTYLDKPKAKLAPGLPVGFELFRFEQWPPFLVDLLPGGAGLGEDVKRLPETMLDCRVDDDIIQRLTGWIKEVATGLAEARSRTFV